MGPHIEGTERIGFTFKEKKGWGLIMKEQRGEGLTFNEKTGRIRENLSISKDQRS